MARNHISYDDMELGILRVALSDFVSRSHDAARQFEGQDRAAIYRRQADKAAAMVERLRQGHTGLSLVKGEKPKPSS